MRSYLQGIYNARDPSGSKFTKHSPGSGISGSEAAEVWDIASKGFAENASGTVNVFSTGAKEMGEFGQRTWWRIEKPALLKNQNVTEIIRRNKDGSISKTGHIEVNPE